MKRIVNGRLWDDAFMHDVGARTFEEIDPVTRTPAEYREELKREYVIKAEHTLADTWVKGDYGHGVVRDNCDLTKGQFVLKISRSWDEGAFILLSDDEARAWFEKWCPGNTKRYEEVFGRAGNPWTDSSVAELVEQNERRFGSMKREKELAEERAAEAEAEIARLKAKLETFSNTTTCDVSLSNATRTGFDIGETR